MSEEQQNLLLLMQHYEAKKNQRHASPPAEMPFSPMDKVCFLVFYRPFSTREKKREPSPDLWVDYDGSQHGFADRIGKIEKEMGERGHTVKEKYILEMAGNEKVPIKESKPMMVLNLSVIDELI